MASLKSLLSNMDVSVGDVEVDQEATTTALGTVNTNLGTLETDVEATNTKLDTVNTNLGTLETDVESVNTKLDTVNTNLGTLETDVESLLGSTSLIKYSTGGGHEKKTLGAASVGSGADQSCRSTLLITSLSDLKITIDGTADANSWPVPADTTIPLPVSNTNLISMYSATGGDVFLLYRN